LEKGSLFLRVTRHWFLRLFFPRNGTSKQGGGDLEEVVPSYGRLFSLDPWREVPGVVNMVLLKRLPPEGVCDPQEKFFSGMNSFLSIRVLRSSILKFFLPREEAFPCQDSSGAWAGFPKGKQSNFFSRGVFSPSLRDDSCPKLVTRFQGLLGNFRWVNSFRGGFICRESFFSQRVPPRGPSSGKKIPLGGGKPLFFGSFFLKERIP